MKTRSIMEPFIESFVTTLLKATSYGGVAHALYCNDALVEGVSVAPANLIRIPPTFA